MTHVEGAVLGRLAAQRLRESTTLIDAGLTDDELDRVEEAYGFRFADDHRAFLAGGHPVGSRWPDWRNPSDALDDQLRWPIDGVLFDVAHAEFWHPIAYGEDLAAYIEQDFFRAPYTGTGEVTVEFWRDLAS